MTTVRVLIVKMAIWPLFSDYLAQIFQRFKEML